MEVSDCTFPLPLSLNRTNNNSISLCSSERNVVVVVVVVLLNQFTLFSLTPFIAYMTTVLTRINNIGKTWKVIYADIGHGKVTAVFSSNSY